MQQKNIGEWIRLVSHNIADKGNNFKIEKDQRMTTSNAYYEDLKKSPFESYSYNPI